MFNEVGARHFRFKKKKMFVTILVPITKLILD
jgi:hypothetical protein